MMNLWKTILSMVSNTQTLKDQFLETISEEMEETPEEIKAVAKATKNLKGKPSKAKADK